MRTVGQILKQEREAKFYTLDEVEKATKIRQELLEALEAGKYEKLPPPTFIQGFIKNYAKFLRLDSVKLLAIFRRDFENKLKREDVLDAFANPLDLEKLRITPTRVLGTVIILIVLIFFTYLWFQYRSLVSAPNLTLSQPQDQLVVENPEVVVEGKTDPEVKVMINNQSVGVNDTGEFNQGVRLSSGVNKITVTAISKFGQKVEVERTVYLKR